jgi:hypothetical protein
MLTIRRWRRFLNLRLTDVSNATGIPTQRLSCAERALLKLDATERLAVESFIRQRLLSVAERDRGDLKSDIVDGNQPSS